LQRDAKGDSPLHLDRGLPSRANKPTLKISRT
jgi:hypothetical protein